MVRSSQNANFCVVQRNRSVNRTEASCPGKISTENALAEGTKCWKRNTISNCLEGERRTTKETPQQRNTWCSTTAYRENDTKAETEVGRKSSLLRERKYTSEEGEKKEGKRPATCIANGLTWSTKVATNCSKCRQEADRWSIDPEAQVFITLFLATLNGVRFSLTIKRCQRGEGWCLFIGRLRYQQPPSISGWSSDGNVDIIHLSLHRAASFQHWTEREDSSSLYW